jgi:hypothetical protein
MDKKMNLEELAKLMIEHGLVIRAIPYEKTSIYEAYHKDEYPDGIVCYMESFKRDMLQVTTKNSQGGKFIIEKVSGQDSIIRWGKGTVFYDTIEEAVESFIILQKKLGRN